MNAKNVTNKQIKHRHRRNVTSHHSFSLLGQFLTIFSVTRRSRSDESHSLTHSLSHSALALTLLMWPWWVMIPIEDFTDVILITLMKVISWWKLSSDESYPVMKVTQWWKLSIDEIHLVVKVILWWKLSSDEIYLVMKVTQWWKLPGDESYLVMKVI